jgi:hypothetical protein
MPDIAMCANTECPKRTTCYRHTAEPSERQAMVKFFPDPDGTCSAYIPVEESE